MKALQIDRKVTRFAAARVAGLARKCTTAPTTSRIVPTVAISMPETVAVTAKRRMAPIAIRKMDVPIPIVFPSRDLVTRLRYHL